MQTKNLTTLLIAVGLIVGAIVYLDSGKAATAPTASAPDADIALPPPSALAAAEEGSAPSAPGKELSLKQMRYERAKEITTPDGFINTSGKPVTISEFVGQKVVLLDIWTYSCINCQRTLPYLKLWWEKYKDKGLVIIGLHTPEFEFEKKYENVLAAVKKFGVEYPVVLDNDYSTWRAYRNQYWPRKYLIDIDGYIVYDHIGESGYEETERQIQKALAERMARANPQEADSDGQERLNVPLTEETSVPRAGSPEVYFGASRNEYLANGERGRIGVQTLTLPESPSLNRLYLGGEWNIQPEYSENQSAAAVIEFRYKAKEVYFVASSENGVNAKMYNDGVLVQGRRSIVCSEQGFCGGEDVAPDGAVFIKEDRLYKLIQNSGIEEHTLKIKVESPGLKAFTFTFG